MIRDKFYKDILQTIEKHPKFDVSDFTIKVTKLSIYRTQVVITLLAETKYKFEFEIPNSVEEDSGRMVYKFSGKVSPGPLSVEETFSVNGINTILERISIWLGCIWEDLTASPVIRNIEEQQKAVEEIFKQFTEIKDEFFTREEASELKERLDDLERKLQEEIEQKKAEKAIIEEEKQKLRSDIETLKQTITTLKKKGWLRSFTSKVVKWGLDSENRKLLKEGYTIIRDCLPENAKQLLP